MRIAPQKDMIGPRSPHPEWPGRRGHLLSLNYRVLWRLKDWQRLPAGRQYQGIRVAGAASLFQLASPASIVMASHWHVVADGWLDLFIRGQQRLHYTSCCWWESLWGA